MSNSIANWLTNNRLIPGIVGGSVFLLMMGLAIFSGHDDSRGIIDTSITQQAECD